MTDDMQVYAYVFRLLGQDADAPPSAATNGSDHPHSITSRPSSSASHVKSESTDSSPPRKVDSEPEKLVRNLLSGNQALVSGNPWRSQGKSAKVGTCAATRRIARFHQG